jgi:Rps23 Pro-64 3,4-dihydroxylase Tpa1-like proline 4-hydroxylase
MLYTSQEISELIVEKISQNREVLKANYKKSIHEIGYFYIDDLLPNDLVLKINSCFPEAKDMILKKSIREDKYIAVQMDNYDSLLEQVVYAFQHKNVVNSISEICEIEDLHPDVNLYAGGLSLMENKQFLNPHLDNSHDKDMGKWRVLNLLFYVNPNWQSNFGGNLELWPKGLNNNPIVVASKFNRLVVMATHQKSWHSVSPITNSDFSRKCVSNYYFSNFPLKNNDSFHVTTFRGRPNQPIINQLLKLDSFLRMKIRNVFKKGIITNKHVYKK